MRKNKNVISEIERIASDTEDFDTAISLHELASELRNVDYETKDDWDFKSIIIGVLIGIAVIILFNNKAYADEINIHLTSWHSDKSYNYNKENYGIGYTVDDNKFQQTKFGFYNNSYNKISFYAAVNLKFDLNKFRFGTMVGFVTGYDNIALTKDEVSKLKHLDNNKKHKKHFRPVNQKPASLENMNEYQFIILPNITYKIDKSNSASIGYVPSFNKHSLSILTFSYNYVF